MLQDKTASERTMCEHSPMKLSVEQNARSRRNLGSAHLDRIPSAGRRKFSSCSGAWKLHELARLSSLVSDF